MRTYPRSGFSFRGNIRMFPRSCFRSGGTSAKTLLENHPSANPQCTVARRTESYPVQNWSLEMPQAPSSRPLPSYWKNLWIHGCGLLSNTGLGFGNLIGRAQLIPAPALGLGQVHVFQKYPQSCCELHDNSSQRPSPEPFLKKKEASNALNHRVWGFPAVLPTRISGEALRVFPGSFQNFSGISSGKSPNFRGCGLVLAPEVWESHPSFVVGWFEEVSF